jgi:predicted LPLAT superfamily acyltransferase
MASSGPAWGLRFLKWAFDRLPLKGAYVLVIGLAPIWFLHYNRPRYGVVRAMQRMGARFPWWAALRAYGSYTLSLVDRWYVRAGRAEPILERENEEAIEAAVADRTPLVYLGSHCGSLDIAGPRVARLGRRVRAVALPDPEARQLLDGVGDPSEEVDGCSATIIADGSARAGLRMLKALRAGEILALKADRFLPRSAPKDRIRVPFFGEEIELPCGPAEMVRRTGSSAQAISVFRTGPCRFAMLADPLDVEGKDAEGICLSYAAALERQVGSRPDQWFNFFPYWPADREALAHLPETVPPGMRAGSWAIRGALVTAVLVGLLGLADAGAAAWAGVQGGLLAAILGMSLGAAVDRHGERNAVARATAVLGPVFAAGLPLVALAPLGALALLKAIVAMVVGVLAGNISRRPPPRP